MDQNKKTQELISLYSIAEFEQAIVFVNTKAQILRIKQELEYEGIRAEIITGDLLIEEREAVLNAFRAVEFKTLISSDMLSRGIDIPLVDLVVNYDLPFK
jgi:ATP-dependent RNA helicase DDX19/DBP5